MRAVIASILLLATTAAADAGPSCDQFRARMERAEAATGVPVPPVKHEAPVDWHGYAKYEVRLAGIDYLARCEGGRFADLRISTTDAWTASDNGDLDRMVNLTAAAIYAYAGKPQGAHRRAEALLRSALADLRKARVRGGGAASGIGETRLPGGGVMQMWAGGPRGSLTVVLDQRGN